MKKILKLMGSIFNITRQYDNEKSRYYKSGYFWKIVMLLLMPVMISGVVACGYGTYWLFANLQFGALFFLDGIEAWFYSLLMVIGGFVLAYVTIGFAIRVMAFLIQHAIIAFRVASEKKKVQTHQENVELAEGETHVEHIEKVEFKTSRGFDIFYGVMSLLLLIGSIVGIIVFFGMIF